MDQENGKSFSPLNSHREEMAAAPANNEQVFADTFKRLSLGTAAATPLPESSPAGSPGSGFKPFRNGALASIQEPQSPTRKMSTSRPVNSERRSSTPLLHSKRSTSSLQMSSITPTRPSLGKKASSGRLSSNSNMGQRLPSTSTSLEEEKRPIVTAASTAQDHFKKELEVHSSGNLPADTLAIIHDSCYGHRYSRPRTSKSSLSSVVERPERIHASILGLSTAYVRLGGRHVEGHAPLRPDLDIKTIPSPPFHIKKTDRTIPLSSPAVTQVHGSKWMEELQIMCESAESKLATNGKELARPAGFGRELDGSPSPQLHEGDLYLCRDSLDALQGCLGGVCEGVDTVFGAGPAKRAFVCIRPPGHHCSSTYPSGFCWLNNVHVGIAHAAMTHGLTHAAIIDFDLHHGDGSQSITWSHNQRASTLAKNAAYHKKLPIGYYSLHDINSYPCEMGDEEKVRNASICIENAHGQSIWNVHLEPWKTVSDFWQLYRSRYSVLLEKARNFLLNHSNKLKTSLNGPRPKAAIFISAGFDACEWEGSGMQRHKVNVPTSFYAKFTSDIISLAEEEGLGVDGRIISVLEGGYSDRALTSGILSHMCGLACYSGHVKSESNDLPNPGAAVDLSNGNSMSDKKQKEQVTSASYDTEWWEERCLQALEDAAHPLPAPALAKKPKDKAPGNYSSPTQSSTAKMVDPSKARRYSGLFNFEAARLSAEPESPEPLPEVDWVTASFELSQLLIPTNRQTLSYRHDELNAEVNRVRRERQSIVPSQPTTTAPEGRMQLRERRTRPTAAEEVPVRAVSRTDRRRTIAALGDLPESDLHAPREASLESGKTNARSTSRRLSAASSVLSSFSNLTLDDRHESAKENGTKNVSVDRASRAPSAVSERGPKPLVTKKTRAPVAPKSSGPKLTTGKTSPKKSTTGSNVQKAPSSRQAAKVGEKSTAENSVDASQKTQGMGSTGLSDLDNLPPGMKKMCIKLKVPSPEENAAREKTAAQDRQGKVAPEKPKKPRASKRSAAPKMTKPTTIKLGDLAEPVAEQNSLVDSASSNQISAPRSPISLPHPPSIVPTLTAATERNPEEGEYVPQPSDAFPAQAPVSDSLTASAPAVATLPENLSVEENSPSDTSGAVSGAASAAPTLSQSEIPDSLPSVLDNKQVGEDLPKPPGPGIVSTPSSAKKTRADLPVFTSTSPIPFARSPAIDMGGSTLVSASTSDGITWGQKSTFDTIMTQDGAADPAKSAGDRPAGDHQSVEENSADAEMAKAGQSIWEVPETPKR